jgi:hypothetical protein
MFILINSHNLFSQKEFTNWIFGRNAGISFNTPDLKTININGSQLNTWEGCSSVSDKNGNLLFYSDGTKVWNKNNQLMPNGTNLNGYYSASQSGIVVKSSANLNQYYLFTIDGVEQNKNGLSYSVVDMTLNNGLGDVVSTKKNIKLIDRTVENLCTVRHSNNQDTWVINYSTQQNSFFVFLITKNGVNNVPVKSPGFSTISSAAGYSIKSSKSGSMVGFANQRTGSVEVYDFDKTNGTLKKKYNIKTPSDWAYAVEFSPNERFLYTSVFEPCKIIQYDLNLANETIISQNSYILGNNSATFYYGLIQIAPDGKIYIAKDGSDYLAAISLPDELGSKCNYVENSFLLTGKSGLGLPNYSINEYFREEPVLKITTNSPICDGDDLLLFADSVANAQYFWYGPDGFKSNQQNPILKNAKSTQSGKYYLYTTIGNFVSDTISIDVSVSTFQVTPGDSSLIFVGTASKIDNYIKLTNPIKWDGGSIWLKNRFSVKQDFATTFKFRYKNGNDNGNDDGSLPGADGLAFVMQNHNYPVLGVKGGSIGYTGITNSMAIEFDLYKNPWDPDGNHIAVQSMGSEANQPDHTKYNSCMGITNNIITIQQDSMYFAKIEYDWGAKTLKIYFDSTGKFESPVLTIPNIDIASNLQLEEGEYVYIGFTAGTGEAYQEHDLFDWTIPCKNQLVDVEDNNLKTNNEIELSISPNPTSYDAVISYNIEKEAIVNIKIINAYGQEISNPISNKFHNAGNFSYNFQTASLSEGVYLVILQRGSERISILFLIMK